MAEVVRARSVTIDLDQRRISRVQKVMSPPPPSGPSVTINSQTADADSEHRIPTISAIIAPGGEEFTPDTVILLTQTPQTVINANSNDGHVFQFEAGTWPAAKVSNLNASANNQVFQGVTNGTPVTTTPLDENGVSLGMTKTLWPSGTPTAIMDGGGTATAFMLDNTAPITWTGIRIRRLKIQNFLGATPPGGIVGGRYTRDWIIEECWLDGGKEPVKAGQKMIVRKNRISNTAISWLQGNRVGFDVPGAVIIEDNEIYDINLAEAPTGTYGNPTFHAGMKIVHSSDVIVRRNYIRNVHGPGVWADSFNDGWEIYDNILVDTGINNSGTTTAAIFLEISGWNEVTQHKGCPIHNNWILGSGGITVSNSESSVANPIWVYENTVDTDTGLRQGLILRDENTRVGGHSTASHPPINTNSLVTGRHFSDHVRFANNVVRKRNAEIHSALPIAGMQSVGNPALQDFERNYEWVGNKYEINSAIANPFRWASGTMNFTAWRLLRAAANNVQNTGPLFDTAASGGAFVVWNGTPQFANTACGWEG